MSETVSAAAGELRRASALVEQVVGGLRELDLSLPTGPGRLAEVGLELRQLWSVAVDARLSESRAAGAELAELAGHLDHVVAVYAEIDDGARRRHEGVA